MKISGHKKEKDFYRYIRISAEEAAFQIEKIWKEREELKNPKNRHTYSKYAF